jgi:hypothetical protein
MRRGRRVVALVVLAALAVGVGLFVAVWALGDGGTNDGAGDDPTTTEADTTTTTVIDSVDALSEAIGCEGTNPFEGALAVAGVADSAYCSWEGHGQAAGLHRAVDGEAQAELVRYFDEYSGGWTPNGCDRDTPQQREDRFLYAIVSGDGWVVTTRFPDLRDAAVAAGGEEIPSSPESVPPASYFIDGPPCGLPPLLSPG